MSVMYSLPFYVAHNAEYTALLWQRVQRETQEFCFLRIQTLLPSFGCNGQESQLPNTESCWGGLTHLFLSVRALMETNKTG